MLLLWLTWGHVKGQFKIRSCHDYWETTQFSIYKTCFDILMSFSVANELFNSCTLKTESSLLRDIVTLLSCCDISSQGLGMSGPLPRTLILFMTKICDITYPIYDANLKSILFKTCVTIECVRCHAIDNKIKNHASDKVKKLWYCRRWMKMTVLQV